jgi:hypothetical protein
MLDGVARMAGIEPGELSSRPIREYAVGHFAEVEAACRKDERAHLEYDMATLRQRVNEAMGLVQPLITRVGDLESRVSERDRTIDMMAQTMLDAGIMEDGR